MVEADALASGSCSKVTHSLFGMPAKCVYKSIDGRAIMGINVKDTITFFFEDGSIYSSILGKVYFSSFKISDNECVTHD